MYLSNIARIFRRSRSSRQYTLGQGPLAGLDSCTVAVSILNTISLWGWWPAERRAISRVHSVMNSLCVLRLSLLRTARIGIDGRAYRGRPGSRVGRSRRCQCRAGDGGSAGIRECASTTAHSAVLRGSSLCGSWLVVRVGERAPLDRCALWSWWTALTAGPAGGPVVVSRPWRSAPVVGLVCR